MCGLIFCTTLLSSFFVQTNISEEKHSTYVCKSMYITVNNSDEIDLFKTSVAADTIFPKQNRTNFKATKTGISIRFGLVLIGLGIVILLYGAWSHTSPKFERKNPSETPGKFSKWALMPG